MGAPAVAVVILKREREVMDLFRSAGATSPAGAMTLDQVGVVEAWPLSRLKRRSVIREASPGRYYLDEEVWLALRAMKLRIVLVLAAVAVITGFLVWIGFVTLR
jgi:hypothetical protein